MATDPQTPALSEVDRLRGLSSLQLSSAKSWIFCSIVVQLGVGLCAATISAAGKATFAWTVGAIAAGVIGTLSRWNGDRIRRAAEANYRRVEMTAWFGIPVSGKRLSDAHASDGRDDRQIAERVGEQDKDGPYWPPGSMGADAALRGVSQSAWYSQHLARPMWRFTFAVVVVLLAWGFVAIVLALVVMSDLDSARAVARVAIAGVGLVFTSNILRLALEYRSFSEKAREVDEAADAALRRKEVGDAVLLLVSDYHLARAGSPPIPDCLWRWRSPRLNALWKRTREK